MYPELLQTPFQFSVDESITLDADKIDYPKSELQRKDVWKKRLKFMVLENVC